MKTDRKITIIQQKDDSSFPYLLAITSTKNVSGKIRKILVPVDFSETSIVALHKALDISKVLSAKVAVAHIAETGKIPSTVDPQINTMHPSKSAATTSVIKRLKALQKELKELNNQNVTIHHASGQIHSEIIKIIKKKKIDLVVMGTHGASGYKEIFIGSNAQRIVTLSDVPVLTIQKSFKKKSFSNILVPIDNSNFSREKVNIAMNIADAFNADIHIVGLPDSKDKSDVKKFKIKIDSVENAAKAHGINYTSTIMHGNNIAEVAMKQAKKKNCDMIVINTGHESKITGIFPGPFAQQIVNHAKIPILSIKHTQSKYVINTPGFGI